MAAELKLEAKTHNEELILNHLKETASDILAEKINNGKKTLQGCWNYITSEAKKKAINGCACIEDKEVFGWATHYFYEDSISECTKAPAVSTKTTKKPTSETTPKPTPEAPPKTAPSKKQISGQCSLFDLLGE